MHMKRNILLACLAATLIALPGCSDSDFMVPNLNNPELGDLQNNPTVSAVRDATQGLLIGARNGISNQAGYIAHTGILGRESYTLDNSDPRFVDQMLAGVLNPGDGAFGGSNWTPRYQNIRLANIVLNALDNPTLVGFTEDQKEAIRGFVKMIQALDYLLIINLRDTNGAVVDVNVPIGETPGDIVPKEQVFDRIVMLLDEAQGHLQAADGGFPFNLTEGFAGFDTPISFLEFNRALRARVAVYREDYAAALTALENSFVDAGAPLDRGVYNVYGTGGGNLQNGIAASPNIFANPTIADDVQMQDDGTLDDRFLAKTQPLATPVARQGIVTDLDQTVYTELGDPIPIITNEELLLLRAEARWFTGNEDGAIADLNFVRTTAGGLEPIAVPESDEAFIDALLYEREFSLLLQGHRWIDHRRFDRLDELPLIDPSFEIPSAFPIPRNECLARDLTVPCGVS